MNVRIDHPTDRPNFSCVTVGDLTIWFSYKTPIAFQDGHGPIVARENDWSNTTGKHLAYVQPDKNKRVSGQVFEELLSGATGKVDA